jgi:hypothetical protein
MSRTSGVLAAMKAVPEQNRRVFPQSIRTF